MKTTVWRGCYDGSWKGLITPASFAHPAKFSRALVDRIFDYCLERGWISPGDMVGDPFGGVGLGGIVAAYRGVRWVGVELERRFCSLGRRNFALHTARWKLLGCPRPVLLQGDSRRFHDLVQAAAVVSSPPFQSTLCSGSGLSEKAIRDLKGRGHWPSASGYEADYGSTPGQIGRLKAGSVDAAVSSPPYAQAVHGGNGIDASKLTGNPPGPNSQALAEGYGQEAGQICRLKAGDLDAAVSSPPYAAIAAGAGGLNTKPARKPGQQSGREASSASQTADQRYGQTEGQIAQLKPGDVDGVVSSPPFSAPGMQPCIGQGVRNDLAKLGKSPETNTPIQRASGNIECLAPESYWQAMLQVYASTFAALKPGGYALWVLKDYCAKGRRVRLCDDTLRLLVHVGFEPVERIRAMLVEERREAGLFGEHVDRTERKSFFRRLHERKLSPDDDRRIDWEEVLIVRKPL